MRVVGTMNEVEKRVCPVCTRRWAPREGSPLRKPRREQPEPQFETKKWLPFWAAIFFNRFAYPLLYSSTPSCFSSPTGR
jgi:hypothetical protein